MDLQTARLKMDESRAIRFSRQVDPETGDQEVVIFWPNIEIREVENCLEYLEDYTSSENTTKRKYIDKPEIQGEVLAGRWRNSRTWSEKDRGEHTSTVYQRLRLGYATTTTATEARILGEVAVALDGERTVRRAWYNLNKRSIHALVTALYADESYASLVVDGNAVLSGNWHNAGVEAQTAEDGSGVIIQTLRQGYVTAAYANDAAINAAAVLVSKTYTIKKSQKTASETVETLIRRFRHIDPSAVDAVAAALESGADIATPQASGEVYSGTWVINGATIGREPNGAACYVDQTLEIVGSTADYSNLTNLGSLDDLWVHDRHLDKPLVPEETLIRVLVGLTSVQAYTARGYIAAVDSVTDPKTNGVARSSGSLAWRNAGVDLIEGDGGLFTLVNTLILGWVKTDDSLPTGLLVEEADLSKTPFDVSDIVSTNDKVHWYKGIDPDYASTIKPALDSATGVIDVKIRKEDDGSCSIFKRTRTLTITAQTVTSGSGFQASTEFPSLEAEGIRFRWYDTDVDDVDTDRQALEIAPSGYRVDRVEVDNSRDGVVSLTQVLEAVHAFPGSPTATHTKVGYTSPGFDSERIDILWLKIADDDLAGALTTLSTTPAVAGYAVGRVSHNYSGRGSSDVSQQLIKVGTTNVQVDTKEEGSEAESRTVIYPARVKGTFSDPTAPTGYTELNKTITSPDAPVSDYIFRYQKTGTSNYDIQTEFLGYDAETIHRIYPNRASDPSGGTIPDYHLTREAVDNPDGLLQTYHYFFQKTGTTAQTINTRFPGSDSETRRIIYRDQATDPSSGGSSYFAAPSGYTLMGKSHTGSGRGIEDYYFDYVKNGTSQSVTVGIDTPGFMQRDTEVYVGIADSDLDARMTSLKTHATKVVASVKSDYAGEGLNNIRRVLITLPSDLEEEEHVLQRRDDGNRVKTWAAIATSRLYATGHDTATGSVTSYGKASVPALVPSVLHVNGKQLQHLTIIRNTAWSLTKPTFTVGGATGTYANHVYERMRKDRTYGFWIMETTTVTIAEWTATVP